jgi:GT2 family glycosyltransferase
VVPVYGDFPSLIPCVRSLIDTVDQSMHRVLLVNDVGPRADEIETALLELIEGQASFAYARNPSNLGFVGTCNRAAFELDATDNDILLLNSDTIATPGFIEELSAVLNASPEVGAVCARSNNATIASLPYGLRDRSAERTPERTIAVHAALRDVLPRSSAAPVAMGFCLLVRRSVIQRFGLFDDAFAPGYGEENDFCLRIAAEGFSSHIAHRALVLHLGSRSFAPARRAALRAAHERLLVARYPHYPAAVRDYIFNGRDPVDVFADALVPGDDVVRVLVDVVDAGRSARRVLAACTAAASTTLAFTVVSTRRARSALDGIWDLAIACGPASPEQTAMLNRTSLRWVFAPEDRTELPPYGDASIPLAELSADVIRRFASELGRSAVDVERLRERWSTLSDSRVPRERPLRRLLRTLASRLPRLAAVVRGERD